MKRNTIDIITLGCSKNLVDSEKLMRQLEANGYKVTHDSDKPQGEIAVINTCGFIGDAKEESINMILEFCQAKEEGKLKKLYVMGCLSERYLKELALEIPQVDKFYGKFNWNELLADLGKAYKSEFAIERTLTTPHHYAYLKISEGCDRKCSYCAIPIITGRHISRPMEEIIDEVKLLVSEGVKEFQIIAQELTYYGVDLYKSQKLPELIERIANVPGVEWIRLHYAYPAHFPEELFRVMRDAARRGASSRSRRWSAPWRCSSPTCWHSVCRCARRGSTEPSSPRRSSCSRAGSPWASGARCSTTRRPS